MTQPIERTSTYRFDSAEDLIACSGAGSGFYPRYGHANFEAVEAKYAALSGAEAAVLFASGMGAIAAVVQGFCAAGDRVVALADLYGGTRALLDRMAARRWIAVDYVPIGEWDELGRQLEGARLFLGESVTNPLLRVLDVGTVGTLTRAAGVKFVLDATFVGPAGAPKALDAGADLVLESATKGLAGHSDLMAGIVAGDAQSIATLKDTRRLFGAVPDPETAWLLDRGLKTYPLRAKRQGETATQIARFLADDHRVGRVHYPDTGGSMVTFAVADRGAAIRFVEALRLVSHAPSLGGVESLACLPCLTSHAHTTPEEREAIGVTDDLVRLSVGLEDLEDLRADLDQALAAAGS